MVESINSYIAWDFSLAQGKMNVVLLLNYCVDLSCLLDYSVVLACHLDF